MWRRWTGCARALSDFAVRPGAPCPPSACWRRTSPGREAAPDPHGVAWSGPPRGRPPPAVDCDALRHPCRAASWQYLATPTMITETLVLTETLGRDSDQQSPLI